MNQKKPHDPKRTYKSRFWRVRTSLATFRWTPHRQAALVLFLPTLLIVAMDAALRGARLLAFSPKYWGSYAASVTESALFWGLLLYCTAPRQGWTRWPATAIFVGIATAALGTQTYFFASYSTYLNIDATLFGTSMAHSLLGQLKADSSNLLGAFLPPLGLSIAVVWLARRWVNAQKRRAARLSPLVPMAVVAAMLIPCSYRSVQGSTPDVIYFHAVGGLLKTWTGLEARKHTRPGLRQPPKLPKLVPKSSLPRNVLFVLTESVRADIGCSKRRDLCPAMPFSNAAMPERMPLFEMRSNSSTTAIQLAVLWSGLEPTAGRKALHEAPVLFDYAHAAGYDTAYWSSHHMLFANSRLFVRDLPTHFQCGATNLNPLADMDTGADDRLLTKRIKSQLSALREPFFAVAHFGNTHTPYVVDENDLPFRPQRANKAERYNEEYRNYYKNAVHRQDKTVGELLRWVRSLPLSKRTIIIYTSDHGEQFREHGQLGHTASLFDVEIRVPTWIDAPEGSLTKSERSALASYANAPTFHTDLPATMLDLMGLWQTSELSPFRKAMVGDSLLRPGREDLILALSNCSGVWGCAFENWGMMKGFRKLIAREWDHDWLCYDVRRDPTEMSPLPLGACTDLRKAAAQRYGRLPGKDGR